MERGVGSADLRVQGFPVVFFLFFGAVVVLSVYLGVLPSNMVGAFALMIFVGAVFGELGDRLPVFKDFLGGGPIVVIFGSAALVSLKVLPEAAVKAVDAFMKTSNFLDFYIAALITGSILGMNRALLVKASARYFPALFGAIAVSLGLAGLAGLVTGYGMERAILYVGVPIMGGGMGAGAVPMSKIYGQAMGQDPKAILSIMVPAVALGNALSIVAAGLLDRLGKVKPSYSGGGKLMRSADLEDSPSSRASLDLTMMGMGMFMACCFYALGSILGKFVPSVHPFAWMIISVALVKALRLLPEDLEQGANQWYRFVVNYWTRALLVGIGVSFTSLPDVVAAMASWQYLLIVLVTVVGAILGAWVVGRMVGFYPIESSVTAGLCMANMGGTGDVAVLSACRRMELMPFAQISSRIGGAIMLIIGGFLVGLLGKGL